MHAHLPDLVGVYKTTHQGRGVRRESTAPSLDVLLHSFEECFTRPGFVLFRALVCGWVLCRARKWISAVIVFARWFAPRHHSSFYRFFTAARWSPDALGRKLFELLLPRFPDVIDAMVDDTLCRRAGPRIFGISMQRDGSASGYGGSVSTVFACGHSWVVLSVRLPLPWNSRGCAVPVLARLYRSPKRCSKSRYRKRTELAREMLELLASWLPDGRTLHLSGDREYACRTLLRGLSTAIEFTGPMPMDASLFGPVPRYKGIGRPRLRGEELPNPRKRRTRVIALGSPSTSSSTVDALPSC